MAKVLTAIAVANLRYTGAGRDADEVPNAGCRGLAVVVQPSGHKSWRVRYRFRGRSRKLTLGPVLIADKREILASTAPVLGAPMTLADARWKAAEALRLVASGIDPGVAWRPQHDGAPADDSVRAVGDQYLKRHTHLKNIDRRRYDLGLLDPTLGARPIASVKRTDLVRLLDRVEAENGPAAADQVGITWGAVARWHAGRVDDFRPPLLGRGSKRNKNGARSRVLNDDELRAVWAAAETVEGAFGPFVRFLLLTACRRNEAAYLRRSELTDSTTWLIPSARCKTKHDTLIPLSGAAQKLIRDMPIFDNTDFVFTNDGKRAIGGFSKAKRELDQACRVTGWTLHDLRRTARTLLSRAGVDADIAERCLGHVIRGVRGVYDRHQFEREKRDAFERLAGQIERILNPQSNIVPLTGAR